MATPYMSQICVFAFGVVPKGFLPCNGQLMSVTQNQALFSLLGTTYGGDGKTTFALPNLQGRFPLGNGNPHSLGELGGEAAHTLTGPETPQHIHPAVASRDSTTADLQSTVQGNFPAAPTGNLYSPTQNTPLGSGSSNGGGGQPHNNMQPYLPVQYCIAINGLYPPRP